MQKRKIWTISLSLLGLATVATALPVALTSCSSSNSQNITASQPDANQEMTLLSQINILKNSVNNSIFELDEIIKIKVSQIAQRAQALLDQAHNLTEELNKITANISSKQLLTAQASLKKVESQVATLKQNIHTLSQDQVVLSEKAKEVPQITQQIQDLKKNAEGILTSLEQFKGDVNPMITGSAAAIHANAKNAIKNADQALTEINAKNFVESKTSLLAGQNLLFNAQRQLVHLQEQKVKLALQDSQTLTNKIANISLRLTTIADTKDDKLITLTKKINEQLTTLKTKNKTAQDAITQEKFAAATQLLNEINQELSSINQSLDAIVVKAPALLKNNPEFYNLNSENNDVMQNPSSKNQSWTYDAAKKMVDDKLQTYTLADFQTDLTANINYQNQLLTRQSDFLTWHEITPSEQKVLGDNANYWRQFAQSEISDIHFSQTNTKLLNFTIITHTVTQIADYSKNIIAQMDIKAVYKYQDVHMVSALLFNSHSVQGAYVPDTYNISLEYNLENTFGDAMLSKLYTLHPHQWVSPISSISAEHNWKYQGLQFFQEHKDYSLERLHVSVGDNSMLLNYGDPERYFKQNPDDHKQTNIFNSYAKEYGMRFQPAYSDIYGQQVLAIYSDNLSQSDKALPELLPVQMTGKNTANFGNIHSITQVFNKLKESNSRY
ncbi:hypothetical protein [Ureaplasma ceti]|uniref:Lipoprotein n=1 Tax=Ureaplasma ceti TaxID=3119530 RepID=A0ABP9U5R2_9BACT